MFGCNHPQCYESKQLKLLFNDIFHGFIFLDFVSFGNPLTAITLDGSNPQLGPFIFTALS